MTPSNSRRRASWRRLLPLASFVLVLAPFSVEAQAQDDAAAAIDKSAPPGTLALEGVSFLSGSAGRKDSERALRLFRRSLEESDGCGAVNLGIMYLEGDGVGKDVDRARKYLDFADRFGIFYPAAGRDNNISAQLRLGIALDSGRALEKRPDRAYFWYSIVSGSGSPLSREADERLSSVRKKLTSLDIEEIDRKVREWRQKQDSRCGKP